MYLFYRKLLIDLSNNDDEEMDVIEELKCIENNDDDLVIDNIIQVINSKASNILVT